MSFLLPYPFKVTTKFQNDWTTRDFKPSKSHGVFAGDGLDRADCFLLVTNCTSVNLNLS